MLIILDTVDSVLTLANLSVEVEDYPNVDHGVAGDGWSLGISFAAKCCC